MPLARRARRRTVLVSALASILLAACTTEGTVQPAGVRRASLRRPFREIRRLPRAVGPWRRVPFKADPSFGVPFVAGCRTAEPAIGTTPPVVVEIWNQHRPAWTPRTTP